MLQGVLLTLIAEGIALPTGLITAIVLTRGLGPESYGRFVVVASTVAITEWLLIAVLARAVVKFVAEADDWRPVATTALRIYLAVGLALAAAFWGLAPLIADGLRDPALASYFRLFAPQIAIFAAGAGCRNVLAGQARYGEQALASAVAWLARLGFILLFIRLGWGVHGAIAGSIAGTLTGSVTALLLARVPFLVRSPFPARRLLQLALPAFIAMLAARLLDQTGLLTLQVVGSVEADVGYYGAAMNVMMLTSVLAAAIAPVLISSVSAARHGGDEATVARISAGTLRLSIALLPFAFLVVGSSSELVDVLFGSDYAPAAAVMAWLIVAAVARAGIAIIASLYIALGHAWAAAAIAVPLPIIATFAHLLLIPRFGAGGAAAVSATMSLAGLAISVAIACRLTGVRLPLPTLGRSITLSASAWAIAALWATPGPAVLVKAACLAAAVLGGFLLSGELEGDEVNALKQLAMRRRA